MIDINVVKNVTSFHRLIEVDFNTVDDGDLPSSGRLVLFAFHILKLV